MTSWDDARRLPLLERVGPAPPAVVEYLRLDNILNGFRERPRVSALQPDVLSDAKAALAELPPQVLRLVQDRLLGVYFVDGVGGSGFAEQVVDREGRPVAGYLVLDAELLGAQTANGWATWKERTPFKRLAAGGGLATSTLQARIAADTDDNRQRAIQYILLHELGHILSIGRNIHPSWSVEPRDVQDAQRYPFFGLSWTVDRSANQYVSRFDAEFVQRREVVYYRVPRIASEDMVATYSGLEHTNFASLYAAVNPGEDFAEAFASYVHTVLLKRPWQITIQRDGETVKTFQACWSEPRCADKRAFLEQLLAGGS